MESRRGRFDVWCPALDFTQEKQCDRAVAVKLPPREIGDKPTSAERGVRGAHTYGLGNARGLRSRVTGDEWTRVLRLSVQLGGVDVAGVVWLWNQDSPIDELSKRQYRKFQ